MPSRIHPGASSQPTAHLCLTPSHLMASYHAYCSPVMLVRYSEEEVHLQDFVVFSTELETVENCLSFPLVLEAELLFSDVLSSAFVDLDSMELKPEKEMKSVSVAEYRLNKPCGGLAEFFRINFDDMHFSTLGCSVFALATHFRILPTRLSSSKHLSISDLSKTLFPFKGSFREFIGTEATNRAYAQHVLPFAAATERLRVQVLESLGNCEDQVACPASLALPEEQFFSDSVASHVCADVVVKIVSVMQSTAEYSKSVFHYILAVLEKHPGKVCEALFRKYINLQLAQSSISILSLPETRDLTPEALGQMHSECAKKQRKSAEFLSILHSPVESLKLLSGPSDRPIFFPDYQSDSSTGDFPLHSFSYPRGKPKKRHLVVLVHGFGGTSFDVRNLRNQILVEHPEVYVYSAHTNEEESSDGDILIMGRKLAIEIQAFVHDYFPGKGLDRLSFIGHSMGGLVIRAALPLLSDLRRKLHFLVTLSTPHLGYITKSSALVDLGLWVLKKMKNSLSLNQVTMKDNSDPRKCALYTLSQYEGMADFRHVLFLGSFQDTYAPFESARVQLGPDTLADPVLGPVYSEMVQSILQTIDLQCLRRVDVHFDLEADSVDSVIGRAAHIQFLESEPLVQRLLFGFSELFPQEIDE